MSEREMSEVTNKYSNPFHHEVYRVLRTRGYTHERALSLAGWGKIALAKNLRPEA